jgi:predicted small lipoprotein YifL
LAAPRFPRIATLLVVAAFGLAGCGRRGDLEAPNGAVNAKHESSDRGDRARDRERTTDPADSSRRAKNITPPKGPFVLDPLL